MVLVVLVVLLVFIRISGRHRVVHDHEEEEYFDEIQDVKITKDTRGQIRSATTCRGLSARGGARGLTGCRSRAARAQDGGHRGRDRLCSRAPVLEKLRAAVRMAGKA